MDNNKKQKPITEQKHVKYPPEIEERVEAVNMSIRELFDDIDDDDVNIARAVWRDINAVLIHAFSLGVYDIVCAGCDAKWSVARRQALNEAFNYRDRLKRCPECGATDLRLDFALQLQIREREQLQKAEETRKRIEAKQGNGAEISIDEAYAAARAAGVGVTKTADGEPPELEEFDDS